MLVMLLVSACAEKKITPDPVVPEKVPMDEAAVYWDRKDYSTSQELYRILSQKPDLTARQQIIVQQRLGISAYYNQDFETALPALEKWAKLAPRTRLSWQWQEMYFLSMKNVLGEDKYYRYLNDLSEDMTLTFEIRKKAAMTLAGFHFEQGRYPEAMSIMEKAYVRADTDEQKLYLKNFFLEYLNQLSISELKAALPFLDQEKTNHYPFNIFFWTLYSRQLEDDPSMWDNLWPRLSNLSRQGQFIDQRPYIRQLEEWLEKFGIPATEIALLLPLSGQFSSSGWKILRGAGLAHWEMLLDGFRVNVRTINTEQDGWLEEIMEMESVTIVGGPVSREAWQKIRSSGVNREKVFFTFLPSIDDEGTSGWRFFTSPRDQVRSMIDKAALDLGFTDFAVFYPEDDFGRAYAKVFQEEAGQKGVRISGLQSYPGDEPRRWNNIVASFLDVSHVNTPYKNPSPDFQAVFIPDSLSRVKGLVPQFHYFDQNQLVFMGPMLWSQAYSPDTLEQQYFSLSMTTGAWLDDNSTPGAVKLKSGLDHTLQGKPDFWVALGYDFVRFAAGLGNLPTPGDYERINEMLAEVDFFDWSMAPVSWNDQGKAFQDLYVFQMSRSGLSLADMDYFKSMVMIREARKARWMQMIWEREGRSRAEDVLNQ